MKVIKQKPVDVCHTYMHTSAYAYVRAYDEGDKAEACRRMPHLYAYVSIRIRQSIRQSIRQHASAIVSMRCHTYMQYEDT
jgi:hypothetical protein